MTKTAAMMQKVLFLAWAWLLLLAAPVQAEPGSFRAFDLAQHGSLQLTVPRSWNDQMRQRQSGTPPTILFTPERGYGFNVQLTPLWPRPDVTLPGLDEIRSLVSKAAADKKPQALEMEVPIQEIQGLSGQGYYFAMTDREPKAGEFKSLVQGMLRVGELVLAFTILANDDAPSAMEDALKMLKAARQVNAARR